MNDEELTAIRERAASKMTGREAPEPTRDDGIPRCTQEMRDCSQYDGKRCLLLGCKPDWICEPAVEQMGNDIPDLVAEVERLRKVEEGTRDALAEMRREWRAHRDQAVVAPHSSRTLGRAAGFAISADLLADALDDDGPRALTEDPA